MTSRIAPARRVAFDLLLELRRNPQLHSDELLRSGQVTALSSADRNLTTALVMGVLRWEIALDQRIDALLTKGKSRLAEPVQLALELGALQLLLLDRIPPHAAIFESVEIAKESGNPHAAGLVNAVLRKLAGSPKLGVTPARDSSANEIARAWAHPQWMVERWVKEYGLAAAAAICRYDQYPPPAAVRLVAPGAEEALLSEGIELEPGTFVGQARRVIKGDVTATLAFAQGQVRIQDEASQLVAEVAAQRASESDRAESEASTVTKTILDCCAAPGGKTAILAERNPHLPIVACDISPGRLKAMKSFLGKQKGTDHITYRAVDATELTYDREFALVLCDAPCSGTGTIARNPEIRHRLAVEDLRRQQTRQLRLVSTAMRALAKGGRLVYSTCSLEPEENEAVIRKVLDTTKGFRLLSWREQMQALERDGILYPGSADSLHASSASEWFLRTLPGVHPMDGFFAAVLTRDA
jgi:16S rRNA (cytosine967-C5)-methyltransferase